MLPQADMINVQEDWCYVEEVLVPNKCKPI
jgi:hypothetical protein